MPEIKDNYAELFCEVLKAGLWNKVPEVVLSVAEMRRIWTDSIKQAVSGLVAQSFMNTKSVHPRTAEMLQKRLMGIAATNFRQTHLLADSVKVLRAEGIDPLLLKGLGVASFYHQPLLRECGDIDLYVCPEDYKRSFDVLIGGMKGIDEEEFEAEGKHSRLLINGLSIELHQYVDVLTPKYNAVFQKICDSSLGGGYGSLTVDDVSVNTPEPTFNSMYIFEHIWSHFVAAGVGFRQICDWVMLLHAVSHRLDLNRLGVMLESLDLMKPWTVFGWIAVNLLGLPVDEMPFYDSGMKKKAVKVLSMIMKEGNFGYERKDRWTESGHHGIDTIKHFIVITKRYLTIFPMFGNLAFEEYKNKLLFHLGR